MAHKACLCPFNWACALVSNWHYFYADQTEHTHSSPPKHILEWSYSRNYLMKAIINILESEYNLQSRISLETWLWF